MQSALRKASHEWASSTRGYIRLASLGSKTLLTEAQVAVTEPRTLILVAHLYQAQVGTQQRDGIR